MLKKLTMFHLLGFFILAGVVQTGIGIWHIWWWLIIGGVTSTMVSGGLYLILYKAVNDETLTGPVHPTDRR